MMPKKVVTLGEIMLRLSPPGYKKIVQAESFDVNYGGSEANVAAAICNYGEQGIFVSKVPGNAIGQAAINHLRRYGVDTQFITRGGERLGIYFLETGTSVRASQVIYDRAGASFAEADTNEFDFDKILEGAHWFHTSGITPALSDKAAVLTEAALKAAKAKGITTSIDLNYRKKLWSKEKATQVMSRLCKYADVCIGILEDKNELPTTTAAGAGNEPSFEALKEALKQMQARFGFKYIAATFRESHSANENSISALLYDGTAFHHSTEYKVGIVDRVGGGDGFAGGLIYGLLTGMNMKDAAEFGTAAAALKHTIHGDFSHAALSEVKALLKGDASGELQR